MRVLPSYPPDGDVAYEMPMPASHITSFAGSGLPFPSASIAYNPSQRGVCTWQNGGYGFQAGAHPPNRYIDEEGGMQGPECILTYTSSGRPVTETVPVSGAEVVPHRRVTHHPDRTGPHFYDAGRLPVRSQEQILRSNGYGREWPAAASSGWGSRPRV
jgi:hypothetical protein